MRRLSSEQRAIWPGVPESVKEVAANETSCVLDNVFKFAGDYTITVTTQGLRGKNTHEPATATAQANEWSESVEIPLTAAMVSSNSMQPGHEVGAAVDGNKTTYFQTKSNGNTSDPRPYIDITLNEGIMVRSTSASMSIKLAVMTATLSVLISTLHQMSSLLLHLFLHRQTIVL